MIFSMLAAIFLLLPGSDVGDSLNSISAKEIEKTIRDLVSFENRNTNGETGSGERGVGAAREYLRKKMEAYAANSQGRMSVFEDWFEASGPRMSKPLRVANVVATIRGKSDPDRIYIVGGHYDSINGDLKDTLGPAPGANDDASGTAVVVELARVLSQREFAASIVLVAYVGEEQGLLGSKHHAKALKASGAFVDGMITNDIVGGTTSHAGVKDDRTLRIFSASSSGSDSASRQFARAARETAAALVPELDPMLVFRADRFGRGGDHLPFEEAGFPAIRFTEPSEDYRHQHQTVRVEGSALYGDRIEFVDFAFVAKVARLNAATIATLADAPRAPQGVTAEGALAYETKLSWTPSQESDLAGYEIVWRKTTESEWSGAQRVEKSDRASVPIVLDNHIVGVRAVGKNGARSRVSVPKGM